LCNSDQLNAIFAGLCQISLALLAPDDEGRGIGSFVCKAEIFKIFKRFACKSSFFLPLTALSISNAR
jgi:hypothetical protein